MGMVPDIKSNIELRFRGIESRFEHIELSTKSSNHNTCHSHSEPTSFCPLIRPFGDGQKLFHSALCYTGIQAVYPSQRLGYAPVTATLWRPPCPGNAEDIRKASNNNANITVNRFFGIAGICPHSPVQPNLRESDGIDHYARRPNFPRSIQLHITETNHLTAYTPLIFPFCQAPHSSAS